MVLDFLWTCFYKPKISISSENDLLYARTTSWHLFWPVELLNVEYFKMIEHQDFTHSFLVQMLPGGDWATVEKWGIEEDPAKKHHR